jgi:hypothetical protein
MARKNDKQRVGGFNVRGSADPDALAQLKNSAVLNRAAMTAKQKRDRKRKRVMYDIDPVIKDVVQHIAKREDTSASQFVELLVAYGLRAYLRGDEELREAMALDTRVVSRTPRFYWNLRIPEEWMLALEAYLSEAQKPRKWGE